MSTPTRISGKMTNPNGNGIENVRVTFSLSGDGPPYYVDDAILSYNKAFVNTNRNGYFTTTLYPNSIITPVNSVYTMVVDRGESGQTVFYLDSAPITRIEFDNIIVPVSATTVNIVDIIEG